MSFWNKSPGPSFRHYIKSIFVKSKEPEFLPSTNNEITTANKWNIRRALPEDVPHIIRFWKDHFRRPLSPVCIYNEVELLRQITTQDYILLVAKGARTNDIYGTIIAQPLGRIKRVGLSHSWSSFDLNWIDMYCVHPTHWHKGLGSALLHAIVAEGAEACIFVKEGGPLKSSIPALRSSFYVYRRVAEECHREIEQWSPMEFITFAQSLPLNNPTSYFIHEEPTDPTNSVVLVYNCFRGRIIAIFNKSHEINYETNESMTWCTGILRTGQILDAENNEAMLKLSAAASRHFNSPWVWMDGKEVNAPPDSPWQIDGTYHLYGFHFDSGVYFNAKPLLIL